MHAKKFERERLHAVLLFQFFQQRQFNGVSELLSTAAVIPPTVFVACILSALDMN
jgi:hypothetical protein